MSTLLDNNLIYLQNHYSEIYRTVIQELNNSHSTEFRLIDNENGMVNLEFLPDSILMYSALDPEQECIRWLESLPITEQINRDIVMYGIGLTYHLAAVLRKYPNSRVFLYEPEVAVFIQFMHVVDLPALFGNSNIMHISVGKTEEIRNSFIYYTSRFADLRHYHVEIPFYSNVKTKEFLEYLKVYKEQRIDKLAESGFHNLFGNQMYINIVRNLPNMLMTNSFHAFKNSFKGSAAIIVGGGPSLAEDVKYIEKLSDEWLIIAAGSSVQSLLHFGVTPHLIVSMDPGQYNANVFRGTNLSDIPLLYFPPIHHEILQLHPNNNIHAYYKDDEIVNMFVPQENNDYQFRPTFSVTGTAIQAAAYMGVSTVLFAGQDLSYPGQQMYAAGASHLGNIPSSTISKDLVFEVNTVRGGKNPTTYSMLNILRDIEDLIDETKDVHFINITAQGAVIKGASHVDAEQLVQTHAITTYNFGSIRDVLQEPIISNDLQMGLPSIINKISSLISELAELRIVCNNIERDLKLLKDWSRTRPNKAMKLLAELEKYWAAILRTEGFTKLVGNWMAIELNDYDRRVIEIEKEQQLIKKISLLDQILGKFTGQMLQHLPTIQDEFEDTLKKLQAME